MAIYHDGSRVDGDTSESRAYWEERAKEDRRVAENNNVVRALQPPRRRKSIVSLFKRAIRLGRIAR